MITVISPAKTLDFSKSPIKKNTQPIFEKDIQNIAMQMKHYEIDEIEKIMKISNKLATQVFEYFCKFNSPQNDKKQALLTFNGDVYRGLNAKNLNANDFVFAQEHLLMLSGMFGFLRPLDIMQAYRLEMDSKVEIDGVKVKEFWKGKVTSELNNLFEKQKNKTLINLASVEYSSVIDKKKLKANWLDIDFKENKNGTFKIIGIYAKYARGLMARYIIKNQIENIEEIKKFSIDGYSFNQELSNTKKLCFTR